MWDRLVSPPGETPNPDAFENALAFRGPAWFSRTTNGGTSWETARLIHDPGTINQTIGNQIVVLPDNAQFDGELVDVFDRIQNFANRPPGRGFHLQVIRSTDHGATWSERAITVDRHNTFQGLVVDPRRPESRDTGGADGRHHSANHGRPEQRGDLCRLPGLEVRRRPQQHRLLAVFFGLSMDYRVFILSRIREAFDRGLTTEEAIRHGIRTTASAVTAAAAVMVALFSIFATLSTVEMKQAGVGLAAAVLIDATVVRAVLLPRR